MFEKLIYLLLFITFGYSQIQSQHILTSTDLLRQLTALDQSSLPYTQNLDFIRTNNQQLPLIDDISFRTETDENDIRQQEYLLRFKFNSKKERHAQSQITQTSQEKYQLKQEEFLLNKIKSHYLNLIYFRFISEELQLQRDKLLLLKDKKTIFEKLLKNGTEFNLSKWLTNEDEIIKISSLILAFSKQKQGILQDFFPEDQPRDSIQFSDWITNSTIQKVMLSILNKTIKTNKEALASNTYKTSKAAYNLENAQSKKWFDYTQIKYKGNEKNPLSEEFSLGIAIHIPSPSKNRIKKNKTRLKMIENQYKTRLITEKSNRRTKELKEQLLRLFSQYELYQKHIKQLALQASYDSFTNNGHTILSPLDIIALKSAIIRQKLEKLKIEKDLCLIFVELLYHSKMLSQTPLTNYLSNNLTTF